MELYVSASLSFSAPESLILFAVQIQELFFSRFVFLLVHIVLSPFRLNVVNAVLHFNASPITVAPASAIWLSKHPFLLHHSFFHSFTFCPLSIVTQQNKGYQCSIAFQCVTYQTCSIVPNFVIFVFSIVTVSYTQIQTQARTQSTPSKFSSVKKRLLFNTSLIAFAPITPMQLFIRTATTTKKKLE